jgi:hypothetical protein
MADKKNNSTLKHIIAGVVAFVLLAGVGAGGYAIGRHVKESETKESAVGGMVMTEVDDSSSIKLMSKVISSTEYTDYNIPEGTESAQLVTATVEPEGARVRTFDWYLKASDSFVLNDYLKQEGFNESGENDNGSYSDQYKDVESIELVKQDSLTEILVLCKSGFAQQLNLYARVNGDNDTSAHIAIDYVSSVDYLYFGDSHTSITTTFGYDENKDAISTSATSTGFHYTIGTIQPDEITACTFSGSFITELQSYLNDNTNNITVVSTETDPLCPSTATLPAMDAVLKDDTDSREDAFSYIDENKDETLGLKVCTITLSFSVTTSEINTPMSVTQSLDWYVVTVGELPNHVTGVKINDGAGLIFY